MDNALLYVRVSSKEQEKEGYSLDAQEKLGEEYARRNNLNIVKKWKVSESAWEKEERKAFNEMIGYAKKHENVKHIIFDVVDRMTRNDLDKIKIYTLIKEFDKKVHFSRNNNRIDKNSSPDDEFMLDIAVSVTKKMSADSSRKIRMGMTEKAEQGYYPSHAPLGYRNNFETRMVDVDEKVAPYIIRAFTLISSGQYSVHMVTDILFKEGLKNAKGGRFCLSTIDDLLKNPFYYGVFKWKGQIYQGHHEPLISKGLFDNVQNVLSASFHPHINKKTFHFNNLILCGECGCKVLGEEKKKKYKYYHCTFSKGRHNGISYVREEILSRMFEEPVKKIMINEDIAEWLTEGLKERSRNASQFLEKQIKAIEADVKKAEQRLDNLYNMRIDGKIDDDAYMRKETEFKNTIIECRHQLDNIKADNPNICEDACRTFELAKRLPSLYYKANYEEKAKILKFIASNYTLLAGKLVPAYKKPFDILSKLHDRREWWTVPDSNWRPLPCEDSALPAELTAHCKLFFG